MSQEWILRVLMSAPTMSGRALAASFRMALGIDGNAISRVSISSIKDALLEMWSGMNHAALRRFVSAQYRAVSGGPAAGGPTALRFLSVQLLHIQDEADIRMLSFECQQSPWIATASANQ